MRHITYCPACETQFFVTDAQLNQHEGKVRCGQCLHVFNARQQIIESPLQPESSIEASAEVITEHLASETPSIPETSHEAATAPDAVETASIEPDDTSSEHASSQFDDFLDKRKSKQPYKPVHKWILFICALIFTLLAIAQAIYNLRNEIALYYPATKSTLSRACQLFNCRIELPKKIELIVIDDSDIQEDSEHQGLIWLSSTLINQAAFTQALPNLELTLTDVEDQPKLRRLISPTEYMPVTRSLEKGLSPKEEIRIRIPIDTKNEVLAGYRVLVTY